MRVEVCADSILSIQNASDAKVDRIELCSALGIGGLTASFGLIKEAVDLKLLPIHCLIRPRPGHFFYSKDEIKVIEKNILNARELGCHGVVVGAHDQNFKLESVWEDFNEVVEEVSTLNPQFAELCRGCIEDEKQ